MDISGKVALITGGASGLGLATAEKLLAAGSKVMLVDLNEDNIKYPITMYSSSNKTNFFYNNIGRISNYDCFYKFPISITEPSIQILNNDARGIDIRYFNHLIGFRFKKNLKKKNPLKWKDIEFKK